MKLFRRKTRFVTFGCQRVPTLANHRRLTSYVDGLDLRYLRLRKGPLFERKYSSVKSHLHRATILEATRSRSKRSVQRQKNGLFLVERLRVVSTRPTPSVYTGKFEQFQIDGRKVAEHSKRGFRKQQRVLAATTW